MFTVDVYSVSIATVWKIKIWSQKCQSFVIKKIVALEFIFEKLKSKALFSPTIKLYVNPGKHSEVINVFPANPEAVIQRCSVKIVFWEISQNSQKNTCGRVFLLMKLQASGLQPY